MLTTLRTRDKSKVTVNNLIWHSIIILNYKSSFLTVHDQTKHFSVGHQCQRRKKTKYYHLVVSLKKCREMKVIAVMDTIDLWVQPNQCWKAYWFVSGIIEIGKGAPTVLWSLTSMISRYFISSNTFRGICFKTESENKRSANNLAGVNLYLVHDNSVSKPHFKVMLYN